MIALALATTLAAPAAQQAPDADQAKLIDSLTSCRAITADTERLACLDQATAALLKARENGEVVVLDRAGMRQAKRRLFGFQQPRQNMFSSDGDEREPKVEEIESTLARATPSGAGRYVFGLADGTQWQMVETRAGYFPKTGEPIRIEAGILGSYNARIGGSGRTMKVKRVR